MQSLWIYIVGRKMIEEYFKNIRTVISAYDDICRPGCEDRDKDYCIKACRLRKIKAALDGIREWDT